MPGMSLPQFLLGQLHRWFIPSRERGAVGRGIWTYRTRRAAVEWMLAHLPPHAKILEIGVGDGLTLEPLASRPDLEIHGVDLREDLIREAAPNFPRSHFIAARGEFLPYRSNTFDAVICINLTINLLKDIWPPLIIECARVIQPGGLFISDIRNRRHPFIFLQFSAARYTMPHSDLRLVSTTWKTYSELLTRNHLTPVMQKGIGGPLPTLSPVILCAARKE